MKKKFTLNAVAIFAACFLFVSQGLYAQYTLLLKFTGNNGLGPGGTLISDGTYLYGMTSAGGPEQHGNMFRIKPDGTSFKDLLDFTGANGISPYGDLTSDGTYLYGMTRGGGLYGDGTVFKIKPDGTGYQDLLDFNGANGEQPWGSLIIDSGYLYGMTSAGGTGFGNIFKIKIDGTGYQDLLDFKRNDSKGVDPQGTLINIGDYLYGMTYEGGAVAPGVVFKIKHDGTDYQDIVDFNYTNGAFPWASLITDGTYLYGMTSDQGVGNGTIFKVKTDGTDFETLLNFNDTNGKDPKGSLISDGTYLYGMTNEGGADGNGNVFKIKTDGTGFETLLDFNGTNGQGPLGSLLNIGGDLYGMTQAGGDLNLNGGVIFKLSGAAALPLTLLSFTGQMQHGNALLNWQTASETNTKAFTVERSVSGTNFTPLGMVASTNKPGTNSYSYTDTKPFEGENFYRLKMIDQDGHFTYSGIIKLTNTNTQFGIHIYPNPAGNNTTLTLTTPLQGKYSVSIANAEGKTIKHISGVSVEGINTLVLDTHTLASGLYVVTYTDANGKHTVKLIKK